MPRHAVCLLAAALLFTAEDPATADPLAQARMAVAAVEKSWGHAMTPADWPAAPAPIPDRLDVVLVTGYIDLTCLRLRWDGRQVELQRARIGRSWFYGRGEGQPLDRVVVDPERFRSAWQAVLALQAVRAKPKPPPPEAEVDPQTGLRVRVGGHRFGISRSHAPDSILDWRCGDAWHRCLSPRGMRLDDDRQLAVADATTKAAVAVLMGLLPERGRDPPGPPPDEAMLAGWRGFIETTAAGLESEPSGNLGTRTGILAELAIRLAAQVGDAPCLPAIERAAGLVPAGTYVGDDLRRELGYARERIGLRSAWDDAEAARIITANQRQRHADNDQEEWVRTAWLARDPAGYRAWLRSLLLPGTETGVLADAIRAAAANPPEGALPALLALCDHPDPRIAILAAEAVLGAEGPGTWAGDGIWIGRMDGKPLPRPVDEAAWERACATIQRLAADPAANAPRMPAWPHLASRSEAVALARALPEGRAWGDDRLRAIQADSATDGLLMGRILYWRGHVTPIDPISGYPTAAIDPEELAAWRRVLARGPLDPGVILACERLGGFLDLPSLPGIRGMVATLLEGFPANASFDATSTRLPWLDRQDLWPAERALDRFSREIRP